MALFDVIDISGEKVSEIELSEDIFNLQVRKEILHEVVKYQLAKRRAGTHLAKKRSEVKGSTRKLYRQKGTGSARVGDIRSPIRRGGGVVFGPVVRSYEYKLNKKLKEKALKMSLSSKKQEGELVILDSFELQEIKTKKVAEVINDLKLSKPLFIVDENNKNLELSARNLKNVDILKPEGLNVYDILRHNDLVLLKSSVEKIERRLKK